LVFDYVHVGDRPPDRAVNKLRVSPEQFRENLAAIKQELAKAGTSTVFVTAPTGYGTRGVPAYLVEQQLAVDTTAVLTLHRQYADIVREAAKATGADLLDLERSLKGVERHRDLFMTDGIHFTQLGLEEVAVQMYGYLRRAWPPAQVKDGNL
jgi:lysophospholipase L1-like esterase